VTKLCDECETVAHCLKHGCIPKQTALDKKAENARELGLDYEPVGQYSDIVSDGGLDPRNKFDATPPTAQRKHVTNGNPCWCEPETSYTDPETGASVIVHKEPQ
jgi:hypothetical protein